MIGLGFAVRAKIASTLLQNFNQIDLRNTAQLLGQALGATFAGFAFTLLFGSAMVDWVGMRIMLIFAGLSFILGSVILFAVAQFGTAGATYWLVFAALMLTGLGWGCVEATSNPLVVPIQTRPARSAKIAFTP